MGCVTTGSYVHIEYPTNLLLGTLLKNRNTFITPSQYHHAGQATLLLNAGRQAENKFPGAAEHVQQLYSRGHKQVHDGTSRVEPMISPEMTDLRHTQTFLRELHTDCTIDDED